MKLLRAVLVGAAILIGVIALQTVCYGPAVPGQPDNCEQVWQAVLLHR